jgi:hypothetical protein
MLGKHNPQWHARGKDITKTPDVTAPRSDSGQYLVCTDGNIQHIAQIYLVSRDLSRLGERAEPPYGQSSATGNSYHQGKSRVPSICFGLGSHQNFGVRAPSLSEITRVTSGVLYIHHPRPDHLCLWTRAEQAHSNSSCKVHTVVLKLHCEYPFLIALCESLWS